MSYHIAEHHNPDEARLYEDAFTDWLTQGGQGVTNANQPIGGGGGGSAVGDIYGGGSGQQFQVDPVSGRRYVTDSFGGFEWIDPPVDQPPQQFQTGSDGVGDFYINEHGVKVYTYRYPTGGGGGGTAPISYGEPYIDPLTGKVVQRDSRGNISVVGEPTGGGAAPSGQVSYKEVNGVLYAITLHPDGTITSQAVPGLPAAATGGATAGVNKQSVVIGGQAYTFDPATGTYTKAEGIGTAAANPYDPSKGGQGMYTGSSGGDGGLTRQLASIASAAAKAEAEANRAFQREQLAAQQARDAAQNAIAQGNLDLARQQFAASERHAAEAERIRVTELRGTLAAQTAQLVSSADPLGYSTWLALDGGSGAAPFTNALAQGTNAVTDAANTPAALTLQALAELNNPSGTQTGGLGQQTFNNPSGQPAGGTGGLSGLYGNRRPRTPGTGGGTTPAPTTPGKQETFQVEDPNRPGVQLFLTRGQLNDLIYTTTHAGPNPQTGARINDTTSIGGPMFANGQSSYVDNSGTFVSRTGAQGVPLDSTYTNGGEALTPAAQAGLNNIDPATGLMKMAAGGLTNARQFLTGDAQHPNPWAGGAKPEIVQNPTGAPISVIPAPETQSIATGTMQAYQNPPLEAAVQPNYPMYAGPGGATSTRPGGLSGMFGVGGMMGAQMLGRRPMDAMQYRQQYRPRPEPVQMPRFAYGTKAFGGLPKMGGRRPPSGPATTPGWENPTPTVDPTPIPPTGSVPTPTTTTPTPGGTNTGVGGLTGITPQQSYLDQVAAYRANAQGPDLNFFDVGYGQLDPTYRDVGLMKLQGKFGIPVASAQAMQQRYALAGGPSYGGY